ncbi:hypothetical protein GQ42DRAFT_7969 [Ramicandelaber brevisporus]|nr:hypothetical protein GQ42DRAFT_7969 [Ramicandelaber brevisporus]
MLSKFATLITSRTLPVRSFSTTSSLLKSRGTPLLDNEISNGGSCGRSIAVYGNDPNIAFRQLNSLLANNNIRRERRELARFIEPSELRRNRARALNKKRFQKAVNEKIAIVNRMRSLGY